MTLVGIVACNHGIAAEKLDHRAVLEPFVDDDTFIAAFVDVASLPKKDDPDSDDGKLLRLLPFLNDDAQVLLTVMAGLDQYVDILRRAKVDAVYLIAGLGDANLRGGPILIYHFAPGGKPENLVRMFSPIAPFEFAGHKFEDIQARAHGADKVLIGTRTTVDRYSSLAKSNRPDLLKPIAKLSDEGAVVGAVVCPGPDFRRVVRELWPDLSGPLAPLRGELADRWLHLEAAVNLPPDAKPRLAVQTRDAGAAEAFVELLRATPAMAEQYTQIGERRHELKRQLEMLLDALPPQQDGNRVSITLPTDEVQLAMLRPLFAGAAGAAMESTRREKRLAQFQQLAIAMLNYHDTNKHLPASAAIRSAEGKPLLSWRVALLPYLEENALYEQFHLDEPWDSPHNRALITKMPQVFSDPDPTLEQLVREGKTVYQVPTGAETTFFSDEGTTYREITDGTSKTILIVEVEPRRAVVWTKPEDWEVDLQNPLGGIKRTDRSAFTAAFADARVEAIPVEVDSTKLRGLLTRSGGEVIDWP
jgi:hypothetical protein